MFGSGLNFIHKFVSVLPQLASRSPKLGGAAAAKWQVPPLKTVHDARLSLWQSSARAAAHAQMIHAAVPINEGTLYNHPMVRAATEHARLGSVKSTDLPEPGTPAFARLQLEEQQPAILVAGDQKHPDPVYLSSLFFEYAEAKFENEPFRLAALEKEARKYSTDDTSGWFTCVTNYNYYKDQTKERLYNSWQGTPAGLQYSVIDFKLPDNAIVGVIGDWGTGQDDAYQMLTALITGVQKKYNRPPDAIIHLGDIYYSGTPKGTADAPNYRGECQTNFLDILTGVFNETLGSGRRIPVFTIPGNHEYYCMATGYFREVLPQVNTGLPGCNQPASFFCLRTHDNTWQFLGMDTGYNDANPLDQFNPIDTAPKLRPDEVTWHVDKLDNFPGKTILLSHHQLFSANARLNGKFTEYPPNFNTFLKSYFGRYFHSVGAWLWGHEHNMVLYQNNLLGLAKSRLVGASSYEETTAEDPYAVNFPGAPYLDPAKYRLAAANGYYNHSYAIMDFTRAQPGDPILISYYEYPSWGGKNPNPPAASSLVYTESIDAVPPVLGAPIHFSDNLTMKLPGYGNLAPIDPHYLIQHYPRLDPLNSVIVSFVGGSGEIREGATVQIMTTESTAQQYNVLGAWNTPALYYSTPGNAEQNWTIKKRVPSEDPVIHFGEQFYLVNQHYANQWMTPLQEDGSTYLTTVVNANSFWICQPLVSGPAVSFNENIQLQAQLGAQWRSVGPEHEDIQYYPMMVPGNGVSLQFVGGNGLLVHGAGVQIKTTEAAVGNYNLLGAFMRSACYWYSSGYPNQNWHIWKKDLSVDNIIRKGDLITITNDYYANQWLYSPLKEGNYYLTTTTTPGSNYWRLM